MQRSIRWRCIIPVVFSALCYIGFMFCNPLYISSDNIGVALVVDGYYGSNNFCQYIHPLLCMVIHYFAPIIPTADVFTLLIHLVIGVQIGTLFLLFTDEILVKPIGSWNIYDIGKILAVGMVILLFTSGITIWNTNYTITTGAITLFGLTISFNASRENRRTSWIVLGAVTLCFGCMLRMESALLFLPFVALDVAAYYVTTRTLPAKPLDPSNSADSENANGRGGRDDQSGRDNMVATGIPFGKEEADGFQRQPQIASVRMPQMPQTRLLPVAVIIILLFLSRAAFNAREPYRTAARYNAARTVCVDFPMAPWNSEIEDAAEKMFTSSDYAAATDWCFIDTDFLDAGMMERIAAAGEKNRYELSRSGFKSMRNEMRYTFFHSSLYMVILILLSAAMAIRNVICSSACRKAETVLAVLGGFLIILYFTFRGRAPMRVWEPVIFAVDFCLLMAWTDRTAVSPSLTKEVHTVLNRIFGFIILAILWFSTGQLIAYTSYHEPQPVWLSRIPVENSDYESTISQIGRKDALFIWPNWHAHIPEEVEKTGRLPSQEIIQNNIALGDWLYGQPYFTDFLKSKNAVNPAAALLNRPNTYIMEDQDGIAGKYLQEHVDDLAGAVSGNKNRIIQFEKVQELGSIDECFAYKVKVDVKEEQ